MSEKQILQNWNTFRKVTTDKLSYNNAIGYSGQCKYCKSQDLVEQNGKIHCAECGKTQSSPRGQNMNAIGPYTKTRQGQNMNEMRGWN